MTMLLGCGEAVEGADVGDVRRHGGCRARFLALFVGGPLTGQGHEVDALPLDRHAPGPIRATPRRCPRSLAGSRAVSTIVVWVDVIETFISRTFE